MLDETTYFQYNNIYYSNSQVLTKKFGYETCVHIILSTLYFVNKVTIINLDNASIIISMRFIQILTLKNGYNII